LFILGGTAGDSDSIRAGTGRAQDRLWELLRQAPSGWMLVLDASATRERLKSRQDAGAVPDYT
jgi:hypothetical protein